uniref:Uncharacterized protein n=1 Tax=Escherichia coli TaxID=562 RepID=A0A385EMY3_ECOLX|nr:hypothetical protein pECSIC9_00027 [Escherichia coli]
MNYRYFHKSPQNFLLNFLGLKSSPILLKNSLSIMPGLSAFSLSCASGSDGCVLCNTLSAAPFALLLSCVLCNTFFRFCRVLYSAISSPLAVTEKLYSLSRISAISCRVSPLSSQFSISFRRNLTAADKLRGFRSAGLFITPSVV